MRRLGYVPALDGLRGVAIALVIGRHAFLRPFMGGFGVDVFFVLSGFLITTLLLEERDKTGCLSFKAFYARRARRLLPALVAMLAVYALVETARGHVGAALIQVAAGGFYTANIFDAFWPHVIGRSATSPLWSLAQEEQFYLVAPIMLLVLLRRSELVARRVVLGAIAAVIIERLILTGIDGPTTRIYTGPDTHSDGLMVGMLLALNLRTPASARSVRNDRKLGFVGAGLLAVIVGHTWAAWGVEAPFVNVAALALVCCVVSQPRSLVTRALSLRPIVALGRVSYSIYLWNGVILLWLHGDAAGARSVTHYNVLAATADVGLIIVVACASYRFIEQPWRRRRRHRAPAPEIAPIAA